jgi:hypothetical protein
MDELRLSPKSWPWFRAPDDGGLRQMYRQKSGSIISMGSVH